MKYKKLHFKNYALLNSKHLKKIHYNMYTYMYKDNNYAVGSI
jgi:hypothetical protein